MKNLLIDLGDTLFVNRRFTMREWAEVICKAWLEFPREHINALTQSLANVYSRRDEFEVLFQDFITVIAEHFQVAMPEPFGAFEYVIAECLSTEDVIPGSHELIDYCMTNNIEVVILSNTTFTSNTLRQQIEKRFGPKFKCTVLASGDFGCRKPSRLFFELGIKKFKTNGPLVYVGNSYELDYLPATQFEVLTPLLIGTDHRAQTISNLTEVIPYLNQ